MFGRPNSRFSLRNSGTLEVSLCLPFSIASKCEKIAVLADQAKRTCCQKIKFFVTFFAR